MSAPRQAIKPVVKPQPKKPIVQQKSNNLAKKDSTAPNRKSMLNKVTTPKATNTKLDLLNKEIKKAVPKKEETKEEGKVEEKKEQKKQEDKKVDNKKSTNKIIPQRPKPDEKKSVIENKEEKK